MKALVLLGFSTLSLLMISPIIGQGWSPSHSLLLKVSPQTCFAPATLSIQLRVQPDASDRWLGVGMDSGDFARSSSFTIEPDRKLYSLSWRDVPAGEYTVIAEIGGARVRAEDRATVIVY